MHACDAGADYPVRGLRATRLLVAVSLAILCACASSTPRSEPTVRLIVRWESAQPGLSMRLREVERILGARVRHEREMSGEAHVLSVLDELDDAALDAALQRLAELPLVRYAVRDARRVTH